MEASDLPRGLHVFERGWLSANNILFTDGPESVLIDSGYCTHSEQTLLLVESALGARPLDILVNTHLHSDHCGGNAALQAKYSAVCTLIPPGQAQHVATWDPVALTYSPTGQRCPQFGFTKTLAPGQTMLLGAKAWEVHAAPGHDPHSLLFYEPESRVLISADALWEKGFGVVFPELEGADAFSEVAATLDLIERLNPKTVIPGHGRVFDYAPEVLSYARERLASFIGNPPRHAMHAAKVLLKFKLLEVQEQSLEDFTEWATSTAYFAHIRERFFPEVPLRIWVRKLADDLVSAGAAHTDGVSIANR